MTGNEVSQTVNNFGYDPRTTTTLQSELIWETNDNQLMLGADFNQIDIDLTLASDKTLPPQNIYNPVVGPTPIRASNHSVTIPPQPRVCTCKMCTRGVTFL